MSYHPNQNQWHGQGQGHPVMSMGNVPYNAPQPIQNGFNPYSQPIGWTYVPMPVMPFPPQGQGFQYQQQQMAPSYPMPTFPPNDRRSRYLLSYNTVSSCGSCLCLEINVNLAATMAITDPRSPQARIEEPELLLRSTMSRTLNKRTLVSQHRSLPLQSPPPRRLLNSARLNPSRSPKPTIRKRRSCLQMER
ncbi:hypothetical protein M426DRAFT_195401 [Hypoxylon sp. CI-4A]|nr:hypothetical protein M426DRAFT_195401 [Hypoxylon sp. CI-4A]